MARNRAIFRTENLWVRGFEEEDWSAVHQYASNPDVVRYQSWGPNTEEQTKNFIARAQSAALTKPRTHYEMALVKTDNNELIGGVRITIRNDRSLIADVGYVLRHDFWNKGLMTEAAKGVLRFGFDNLAMNRIWAIVNPNNIGSIRVLEKVGMKQEGVLRQNEIIRGNYCDTLLYAKLKSD